MKWFRTSRPLSSGCTLCSCCGWVLGCVLPRLKDWLGSTSVGMTSWFFEFPDPQEGGFLSRQYIGAINKPGEQPLVPLSPLGRNHLETALSRWCSCVSKTPTAWCFSLTRPTSMSMYSARASLELLLKLLVYNPDASLLIAILSLSSAGGERLPSSSSFTSKRSIISTFWHFAVQRLQNNSNS